MQSNDFWAEGPAFSVPATLMSGLDAMLAHDRLAGELAATVHVSPKPVPVSQGMQSLAMYGLDLSALDGGDEPETRLQTAETYLTQWAEMAKALDQLAQELRQAATVTVGVDFAAPGDAAGLAMERDIGARDSDLPGIRAHVPPPVPAPQPKASTARPALASLTTMRPIDHRPGLWQAPEGQA